MARKVLEVVLVGDEKDLVRAMGKSSSAVGGFGNAADKSSGHAERLGRAASRAGDIAKKGVVAGFGAATAALGFSTKAASDLGEQVNKANVVFGKNGKEVVKWSGGLTKNFGLSSRAALEAAGTFGNMLVPMGFAREKAAGMSKGIVQLAGDMASFNNANPEDVLEALRSGLSGETEPLRKFGVFLNDARLKAEALRLGLKDPLDKNGNLTASAKAAATYSIILKDTKDAQGDFARTSDSMANSQRIAKAEIENTAATLGQTFVPIAAKALGAVGSFVSGIRDGTGAGGKFRDVTVEVWNTVSGAIGTGVGAVKGFITDHRKDIDAAKETAQNFGTAVAFVWDKFVLPVIERVLPAIKQIIEGNLRIIGGIIKVFTGILTGDFGRAWQGVKDIFSGAVQAVLGTLRAATAPFREIAAQLGGALASGFKSIGEALIDAGSWAVRKIAGAIRDMAEAPYNAGRFVLDKFRDGIKSAAEFLEDGAGWVLSKLTGYIHGIGAGFRDVGSFIVDKIGDGLKGGLNVLVGFVNKIISVINKIPGVDIKPVARVSTEDMEGERTDLAGGKLAGAKGGSGMPALGRAMGGPSLPSVGGLIGNLPHPDLPPILGDLGGYLIDHVKDFIKDKVKDVVGSVLHLGGSPTSLDKITAIAGDYGLTMTSGYRAGDPGWHGKNRARDYSDGYATKNELHFAQYMAQTYGGKLLELIHTPLGFGIKNGKVVPNSFYASVLPNHYNHVHVAMARGGLTRMPVRALVGERGPEIVDLPAGARVHSNAESRKMGGVTVNHYGDNVFRTGTDHDRWANKLAFQIATA